MTSYALLACDVFAAELAVLGGAQPPWRALEFLPMGLHDQPDALRAELQARVDHLSAWSGIETVVLAYGQCGNGLVGVEAGRVPLILPRASDCVGVLLGSEERHRAVLKENPGAFFYSPGWVRGKRVPGPDREAAVRALYASRYGDDDERIDALVEADAETFAHHNCAAYVDFTGNAVARAYCQSCAHYLGWQYRPLAGDSSYLQDLIDGSWEDAVRFLQVPPGHAIALDASGRLSVASP